MTPRHQDCPDLALLNSSLSHGDFTLVDNQRKRMEGRCRKTAFVLKKNQGRFCLTEMAIKIWPPSFSENQATPS
jgi:hypothetical protein